MPPGTLYNGRKTVNMEYSGTSLIRADNLGTKLISEVPLFRERIICICVKSQSSVLIKQGVLISEDPLREVPLHV